MTQRIGLSDRTKQKFAGRTLDEHVLTKDSDYTVYSFFGQRRKDDFESEDRINSKTMMPLIEDASDHVKTRAVHPSNCVRSYEAANESSSSEEPPIPMPCEYTVKVAFPDSEVPEVAIFTDPIIFLCLEEGCNSNCHGREYAEYVDAKQWQFNDVGYSAGAVSGLVHRKEKSFSRIRGCQVESYGERRLRPEQKMMRSGNIRPGAVESHEQDGRYPMLLSDQAQATRGIIKDMRSGLKYLKDFDDSSQCYIEQPAQDYPTLKSNKTPRAYCKWRSRRAREVLLMPLLGSPKKKRDSSRSMKPVVVLEAYRALKDEPVQKHRIQRGGYSSGAPLRTTTKERTRKKFC